MLAFISSFGNMRQLGVFLRKGNLFNVEIIAKWSPSQSKNNCATNDRAHFFRAHKCFVKLSFETP